MQANYERPAVTREFVNVWEGCASCVTALRRFLTGVCSQAVATPATSDRMEAELRQPAASCRGADQPNERMENWQSWYTLAVVVLMVVGLVRDVFGPEIIVGGALVLLLAAGVVEPEEAVAGFANPQMLTIGALFVLAGALRETGALTMLTSRLFRDGRSRASLLRIVVPTISLSAFLNNTPLVAVLAPAVRDWSKRIGAAPSKYLIPLSYAAIIGGTCTSIGTSTNLLVSGMLVRSGLEPFSLFRELAPVGIVLAIVGGAYIVFVLPRLLPDRRDPYDTLGDARKEYLAELEVRADCPLVGQSVEEAGLRHLPGLFLVEIVRGDESLLPVRPTEHLHSGDRLVFTGMAETVVDLQKIRGLEPPAAGDSAASQIGTDAHLYEVVVSPSSPLVGANLRYAQFRRRYDAVVVAVQRSGERIKSKIGDIVLRPGDVLLVEASSGFHQAWRDSSDFYLISTVGESARARPRHALFASIVIALMVLAAALKWLPIMVAAFLAVATLIAFRVVTPGAARRSVDMSVLLLIASAIGVSAAIEKHGLTSLAADAVLGVLQPYGPIAIMVAVFALTNVFTELITNGAAAAMMFPFALSLAEKLSYSPHAFAVIVAIAASASFSTPIGYQTNLIVYGPGGYRFRDFLVAGLPLNLLACFITIIVVRLLWG